MKPESLVIAGQPYGGEFVPGQELGPHNTMNSQYAFISCLYSFIVRYSGVLGVEEPHQSIPNLVVKLYSGDDTVGEVLRKNRSAPIPGNSEASESFYLGGGSPHLHMHVYFTEPLSETVPRSLRFSYGSELTRQGISLP
ncbi:hypothetical protein PIB30_058589 [Stylosanthes scabra]|uniref:Uncharacterized protein n=1 Tax=Stylosanthes scabra TaxID=79078 RepID=A0ABU6UKU0_9FABA|nr:hypothetical protein [Stylosanthes scabra]